MKKILFILITTLISSTVMNAQGYYRQTLPNVPQSFAPQQNTQLMRQSVEAARQRYERNEQIQRENAQRLMNQVKAYYNQFHSYPGTIPNGWHTVISMNNYDFCEERQVYVENNRIIRYVIDNQINRRISYPALVQNGKAAVQLIDDNGSMLDMVEIYFLEYITAYISNKASSPAISQVTPPNQNNRSTIRYENDSRSSTSEIKAVVVYRSENCDYMILENSIGYILAEWYGGNDPDLGNIIVGGFNSYGMREFYNLSRDRQVKLYIDDYRLSQDDAVKNLIEKCK